MCKTNNLLLKGGGAYNPLSSTEGALNPLEPPGEKGKKACFYPSPAKKNFKI